MNPEPWFRYLAASTLYLQGGSKQPSAVHHLGEGKSRSFQLLDGFPFGPGANEFLAWHQIGGGEKLSQSLYQRYNILGLVCGVTGPTFGGWFREPVNNISDLRKRRVAAVGLGATVLSQAAVLTVLIAPQDIRSAIQSGKIFGAIIGAPYAIDKTEPKQTTGHIFSGMASTV